MLLLLKETLEEAFFFIPRHISGSGFDIYEPQHKDNMEDESIETMRKNKCYTNP